MAVNSTLCGKNVCYGCLKHNSSKTASNGPAFLCPTLIQAIAKFCHKKTGPVEKLLFESKNNIGTTQDIWNTFLFWNYCVWGKKAVIEKQEVFQIPWVVLILSFL